MKGYSFGGGKIRNTSSISISVFDLAVLRGFGIFDFFVVYGAVDHQVMESHIDRFFSSARASHLTPTLSKEQVAELTRKLVAKNNFPVTYVRYLLTPGPSPNSIMPQHGREQLFILTLSGDEDQKHFHALQKDGVRAELFLAKRPLSKIKSLSYAQAILAKASAPHAFEVLYSSPEGEIFEGAQSNFFLVIKDGALVTAQDDILMGTMRKRALDALQGKAHIMLRPPLELEISEAREAFLTSSLYGVMPVTMIGERAIGDGSVGPMTKLLIESLSHTIKD